MLLAETHAPDRETLEILRLVPFTDDELGAPTADVENEIRPFGFVGVVRYAEIDEPGFLDAGDHLDRMTERLLCRLEKRFRVARAPQGVCADDADLMRL